MKKIYLLLLIILNVFSACSSDNPEEIKLAASFTLTSTKFNVGDEIKITNTSTSNTEIVSYVFQFGNNTTSNEKEPTIYYPKEGEYTIKLVIKDIKGNVAYSTIKVNITLDGSVLVEETNPANTGTLPLEINIHDNKIFITERYYIPISNIKNTYRHVEYDETSKTFNYKNIGDQGVNSGRIKTTFLNNGYKIVTSVQSLNYIGFKEYILDSEWNIQSDNSYSGRTVYGTLQNNDQHYFFGSYNNHPAIEIRDVSGNLVSRKEYENEIKNGFIGDLIKTGNSYIAFGGKFENSDIVDYKNYKPIVLFFNDKLELTGKKIYDSSLLNTILEYWNDINGTFTIRKLNNGNFALYSHNELRVISSVGEELKLIKINNNQRHIQALIDVENGFIVSSFQHLEKYDNTGNLIKSVTYKGTMAPGFVKKEKLIYFAAAYEGSFENYTVFRTFIGAIDSDLTFKQ